MRLLLDKKKVAKLTKKQLCSYDSTTYTYLTVLRTNAMTSLLVLLYFLWNFQKILKINEKLIFCLSQFLTNSNCLNSAIKEILLFLFYSLVENNNKKLHLSSRVMKKRKKSFCFMLKCVLIFVDNSQTQVWEMSPLSLSLLSFSR